MSRTPDNGFSFSGLSVPDLSSLLIDEVLRTLTPEDTQPKLSIPRPATDEDLYQFVVQTLGVRIPRKAVKPGHSAPFDAFSCSYFAKAPVCIWLGARGLAGKTYMLATLGWVEGVTLRANVSILGGSFDQSEKVLEYLTQFWHLPTVPTAALASDPTMRRVRLIWGNVVKALAASQKQARGGHPQRLRLDEADEMDWKLFNAVRGQPMGSGDVLSQTTISSTLHNPEGTMSLAIEEAREKGWPIFQWGYPETLEPHGWLSHFQLERSRQTISAETWRVEVEMGEPSTEGRAIMEEKVEAMFSLTDKELHVEENQEYEFEPPEEGATYATGADWGQTKDFTELATLRTDVRPMRLVAYRFMRRRPYPEMVSKLDDRLARYPGDAAHDYTGVGRVGEFLSSPVEDVTMVGQARRDLFLNYVLAVEREELKAPRVTRLYKQHKYCVRSGTQVVAERGVVPIEQLVTGERVMTRQGWRPLLHVTRTGLRPALRIVVSDGRSIDLTEDHRLATPDGWCFAGNLCIGTIVLAAVVTPNSRPVTDATPPASTRINQEICAGIGMPLATVCGAGMTSTPAIAPEDVLTVRHDLKVVGVAAGRNATGVIEFETVRDRAVHQLVGDLVSQPSASPRNSAAPVTLWVDEQLPQPAAVGVNAAPVSDIGDVGIDFVHVTDIITLCDVVEVWDIGVDGAPEFFANGFIAHNCRVNDLYGHGEDWHPPDGLVACAMAFKAGNLAPVRLLFARDAQQEAKLQTTQGLSRAADFLRGAPKGGNGHSGNGNGARP